MLKKITLLFLTTFFASVLSIAAETAILVKGGIPVKYDKLLKKEAGRYGVKDNLDGPGIENKHFVFFVPLVNRISGDLIGKRQYIPVLDFFKQSTKRHGNNDWGTDITSTNNAFGSALFSVLVDDQEIMPKWENIESVEIRILSDKPEGSSISLTFNGWRLGAETVDVTWTLSTSWESRWIQHEVQFPKDFKYKIQIGSTRHLTEYTYDKNKLEIYGLGDQTYKSVKPSELLYAFKADPANFMEFFENTNNLGAICKVDKEGKIKAWTTYSWAGEPAPLFKEKNWQGRLFEGAK
jgi:hypothetical protein